MADVLVVGHLIVVLFLAGLSWTVAVVVYPGFAESGPSDHWLAIHDAHSRRMGLLVAAPWAAEGLACAGLLIVRPAHVPVGLVLVVCVLGAVTVLLTVLGAVPLHERLGRGYDPVLLGRLKQAHWWRTLAWTGAAATGVLMALNR